MRIGHAGFALVAKRVRPKVPLLFLVIAAYGPDILEVGFDALGHRNKALSHSLVALGIGATVMALGYLLVRGGARDALAVWLTYVWHWPVDFVTGNKPTWPGGPTVGLNLYDRPVLEWTLEVVVLVVCWLIYTRGRMLSLPES